MAETDIAYGYIFEIYDKKELEKTVAVFDEKFGKSQLSTYQSLLVSGLERELEQNHTWNLTNFENIVKECVQSSEKVSIKIDVDKMQKLVSNLSLIISYDKNSPYFVLTLLVTINCSNLDQSKVFSEISISIHPLRLFFDYLGPGLFKDYSKSTPGAPFFIYINARTAFKEFSKLRKNFQALQKLAKDMKEKTSEVEEISKKIKSIRPLVNLNQSSMLSSYVLRKNFIQFFGYYSWAGLNKKTWNPFSVIFMPSTRKISPPPEIFVPPKIFPDSLLINNPDASSGTIIYIMSTWIWLNTTFNEVDLVKSEINELKETIEKLHTLHEDELLTLLESLNKIRTKVTNSMIEIRTTLRDFSSKIETFKDDKYENEVLLLHSKEFISGWTYRETRHAPFFHVFIRRVEVALTNYQRISEQHLFELEKIYDIVSIAVKVNEQKQSKKTQSAISKNTRWTTFATIAILGLTVVLAGFAYFQTDAINDLVSTTEDVLNISKEELDVQKASLESFYGNFKADLNFKLHSLRPNNGLGYYIDIHNAGIYDTYVEFNMKLTAYCDENGNKHPLDLMIFEDKEIVLEKEIGRGTLLYYLPDDLLDSSKPAFEYRLWVETHPSTSKGFLEARDDNKKAFVQYSYIEEPDKWTPEITSQKGGLDCNRDPSMGDVKTIRYTDEEHFLPF